jgi:hypothetical protein
MPPRRQFSQCNWFLSAREYLKNATGTLDRFDSRALVSPHADLNLYTAIFIPQYETEDYESAKNVQRL